jgi:hypothetical protein
VDEIGGACSTNGEKRNAYMLLVEKPEGKRPVGRPRRRWVDNIIMDLGEVGLGWYGLDWSGLGQGLVEGSSEHSVGTYFPQEQQSAHVRCYATAC